MDLKIFEEIYQRTILSIERNYKNFSNFDKDYWLGVNQGQLLMLIRCADMINIDVKNKNQIIDEVESLLF